MNEIPSKTILKLTKEVSPEIDRLMKYAMEEMIKESKKVSKKFNLSNSFVFYSIYKSFIHTLLSPLDSQTQYKMIEDLRRGIGIAYEMSDKGITKETIDEVKKKFNKESQKNIGYG